MNAKQLFTERSDLMLVCETEIRQEGNNWPIIISFERKHDYLRSERPCFKARLT